MWRRIDFHQFRWSKAESICYLNDRNFWQRTPPWPCNTTDVRIRCCDYHHLSQLLLLQILPSLQIHLRKKATCASCLGIDCCIAKQQHEHRNGPTNCRSTSLALRDGSTSPSCHATRKYASHDIGCPIIHICPTANASHAFTCWVSGQTKRRRSDSC